MEKDISVNYIDFSKCPTMKATDIVNYYEKTSFKSSQFSDEVNEVIKLFSDGMRWKEYRNKLKKENKKKSSL